MRGVSVIIPCYNAGAFLDEAVHSVFAQNSKTPFEVVIVDDASTDPHTLACIEHYEGLQNAFPITVVRHAENRGLAATRNTAISVSRGDFILPLDADDRLVAPSKISGRPGFIDQGFNVLSQDSNIDVVSPQATFFGHVEGAMRYPRMHEHRLMFKNHIPVFSMIRKSALDKVGGYNASMRFAEDWDLWVALANRRRLDGRPGGFHRIDEHLVEYRTHGNGKNLSASFRAVNTWPYVQMMKRSPEIFEHHFPLVPQAILPSVLLVHKFGYLGKLGIKSAWSKNASTFMSTKKATAEAMIDKLTHGM